MAAFGRVWQRGEAAWPVEVAGVKMHFWERGVTIVHIYKWDVVLLSGLGTGT